MKKILCIIILIFSLFYFSGCSNQKDISLSEDFILFSTQVGQDGKVVQSINFSVNSKKISEICTKNEEKMKFLANLIENIEKTRDDFLYNFALIYLEKPIEEYKITKGVYLSKVCYFEDTDTVGFKIIFSSFDAFKYYHKIENNASEGKKKTNLFYNKAETQTQFLFSSTDSLGVSSGEKYRQKYIISAKGLSFEETIRESYKPDFLYDYVTPYRSIRSNATFTFMENKSFHHLWKTPYENLSESNEIIIWFFTINFGLWYIFALGLVLIPLGISLVIYYIFKRKRVDAGRM